MCVLSNHACTDIVDVAHNITGNNSYLGSTDIATPAARECLCCMNEDRKSLYFTVCIRLGHYYHHRDIFCLYML